MPLPVAFEPGQLAKTDIDRVADVHRRECFASLLRLRRKALPAQSARVEEGRPCQHGGGAGAACSIRAGVGLSPELGEQRGTEAVLLALREDYRGDRVAAFVAGLGGMLHDAFNGKTEFFVLDDLDPQRLYNARATSKSRPGSSPMRTRRPSGSGGALCCCPTR